jgi:SAM-dependent methyltransferase
VFSWLADEVRWWVRGQRDPDSVAFDAAWGTETARFDLGNYEPSLPGVVDEVLDAVDVGPAGWSFVDLGSGKARAVLLASRRSFVRAVGIEHREALHAVAERNVAAFTARGGPRCPVFLFCGDAAAHPLPDGPLVLYLYNPFPADVVRDVLSRVRGPARLAYVNPRQAAAVEAAGFVELRRSEADELHTWRVYGRA